MEFGVERIAEWMRSNRLRLNPEKTDFLWCATRRRCIHLDTAECLWGLDTALNLCARSRRPAGVRPVHEAPCCVDGRLLLSSAPSHQELHQVVVSWGCEGGCRCFCHFEGGPLQQPARRRASWTDSSRSSMPQRGSSATGGSMTTSHRSSAMFSTGCGG